MDEDARKAHVHEMEERMSRIPTFVWVILILIIPLTGIAAMIFL